MQVGHLRGVCASWPFEGCPVYIKEVCVFNRDSTSDTTCTIVWILCNLIGRNKGFTLDEFYEKESENYFSSAGS